MPLEANLALAGLEVTQRTVELPEMDAVVHLFQCSGMTVFPGGIEINRTDAGKLKPEDIVIGVSGFVVNSFGDLRRALAGRAPGDKVPVTLLRMGKKTSVEVRLGGHGEALPSTETTTVMIRPVPKATKKARAIRTALFGKDLH